MLGKHLDSFLINGIHQNLIPSPISIFSIQYPNRSCELHDFSTSSDWYGTTRIGSLVSESRQAGTESTQCFLLMKPVELQQSATLADWPPVVLVSWVGSSSHSSWGRLPDSCCPICNYFTHCYLSNNDHWCLFFSSKWSDSNLLTTCSLLL